MPTISPDLPDTESMMLSGSGPLLYTSTASMDEMISPKTDWVSEVGRAIESANMKRFKEVVDQARNEGYEPSGFCYRDRNGMWFTPILAMLARNTKKHVALAHSVLKEGPEGGWDLASQKCWVMCPDERGNSPVLLEFEQAFPALLALHSSTPTSNDRAQMAGNVFDFQNALSKWDLDWNRQSEDGHTALMELVRRAPLGVAATCYEFLLEGKSDPLIRNDYGMSALDYLAARMEQKENSDPTHAEEGRKLFSGWHEMSMHNELEIPKDNTPRKAGPRL